MPLNVNPTALMTTALNQIAQNVGEGTPLDRMWRQNIINKKLAIDEAQANATGLAAKVKQQQDLDNQAKQDAALKMAGAPPLGDVKAYTTWLQTRYLPALQTVGMPLGEVGKSGLYAGASTTQQHPANLMDIQEQQAAANLGYTGAKTAEATATAELNRSLTRTDLPEPGKQTVAWANNVIESNDPTRDWNPFNNMSAPVKAQYARELATIADYIDRNLTVQQHGIRPDPRTVQGLALQQFLEKYPEFGSIEDFQGAIGMPPPSGGQTLPGASTPAMNQGGVLGVPFQESDFEPYNK